MKKIIALMLAALFLFISCAEKTEAPKAQNNPSVEKEYQNGGNSLRAKGYNVVSLASIKEITENKIKFN